MIPMPQSKFQVIVLSIFLKLIRPEPLRTDKFELLKIKRDEKDRMPDECRVMKHVSQIRRPF